MHKSERKNSPVFILGAGGMARETLDIYTALGRKKDVCGFLEENSKADGTDLNGKPIHDLSFLDQYNIENMPLLIGAIGTTKRKTLLMKLEKRGFKFDSIKHPSSIISDWTRIGHGCIIAPGTIINCQTKIGNHAIVNFGTKIGHDVEIGNFTTVSPSTSIMGYARLGDEVFIGANATVIDRIKVGKGAIIAAGAVVIKDVPELALVAGNPATVKKIYKSSEEKPW
ncbi:MAG: acetyltransferase [Candidatus Bathyarchaeota archaeon]|nr:acetyltransferase [Candidatus Bathyarchaeota archaeon]